MALQITQHQQCVGVTLLGVVTLIKHNQADLVEGDFTILHLLMKLASSADSDVVSLSDGVRHSVQCVSSVHAHFSPRDESSKLLFCCSARGLVGTTNTT